MNTILSLFEFASQSVGFLFARFGLELLITVLIAYLVALIILAFTKKKKHEIGFSNWFKVCFMYGIDFAIVVLGVITILTIREFGLCHFTLAALSWSLYCGYLLMTPEILLMIGWMVCYWMLRKSIYKSID